MLAKPVFSKEHEHSHLFGKTVVEKEQMPKPFQIAIDGPVAAGKGTISRLVAERLGFLYVDTGAMYRVAAYLAIQEGIGFDEEERLRDLVEKTSIEMHNPTEDERDGRLTTVLLNGEDVSWKIRTEEVGKGASQAATLKQIRTVLVEKQQQIAKGTDVIMEGRDITYRVLPDANLKIYLTAGDVVRAKRRHMQLQTRGSTVAFDEVYRDLLQRDDQDMGRVHDPLRIVDDAWVIDTSDLTIEQVVQLVEAKVRVMLEQYDE